MAKVSKLGYWIAIALLAMGLCWSLLVNIGLAATLLSGTSSAGNDYPVDEEPCFDEIWSSGYGDAKVVRIDLTGVILRGRRERLFGSEPDMVENVLSQIQAAGNDPDVQAILLEVDSPGGAVTPSDEIYTALLAFKANGTNRKILVFIRDLGASGAYYAAMAGDYIMAEPTAIVGSVGVIMQSVNMKGLGDMIGLKSVTIASGENKDMLNPLKEINPQHLEMLQGLVDDMQDRFASIVMQSRGLESRDLLDGRVFTAQNAIELGLIDEVGYWPDAVARMKALLDVEDLYIVRYAEEIGFLEAMMGAKAPRIPHVGAMDSPRFLYQWKP